MSNRPLIDSFSPTAAAVGDTVTVTGLNLDDTSAVSIGGTPVTSTIIASYTKLQVVVAGGTSTGRLVVTNSHGTRTSKDVVTIAASAPTVTLLSAVTGKAGDAVTVTGTHFTGATAVTIGGVATSFTVESDTLITLTVPAGAVTGVVAVTNPAGTGTGSDTYTYVPTPAITSMEPLNAPAGGTIVVTGSGLTGATVVSVGGTNAASYTVNSDSAITAVLGSGATGHAAVTNTHGTATSSDTVTIIPAPTITGFTPTKGPVGTVVIITGTNFDASPAVAFNGTAARATVFDQTSIRAAVPTGATTGTIAVTTSAGAVTGSTFTVGVVPEIDYVSPLFAQVGDTITVVGVGLTGTTAVSLGGVACTSVVVGSDTSVTATIAAATPSGTVDLTTPAGSATSDQTIAIEAAPTVSSRAPSSGAVGAAVVLTGTNFVGITDVSFNSTAAAFAVLSPTSIRATVPTAATTGTITVTNAAGTGTSASFTVL